MCTCPSLKTGKALGVFLIPVISFTVQICLFGEHTQKTEVEAKSGHRSFIDTTV